MSSHKIRFDNRRRRVRTTISRVSTDRPRLSVHKTGRYIYAQVIDDSKSITVASASSLESDLRRAKKSNCNREIAAKVGELVAKRAAKQGVKKVVFD